MRSDIPEWLDDPSWDQQANLIIGMPWYSREEWPEIKRLCPDLDDTYEEWEAGASNMMQTLEAEGYEVVKVEFTAADIRRRERATGRRVKGSDRARMAAQRAREKHKSPSGSGHST